MTDDQVGDVDQARLDRIAALGARRATPKQQPGSVRVPAVRRRRRHPAQRSRIVAAGIGASTMFGIVTMLGVTNAPFPDVVELSARPVVRVVQPAPTPGASATPTRQAAPVATTRGSS